MAAVFASASDAVSAAVDAQVRLAEVLPVRMGLHTGEAELRDDEAIGLYENGAGEVLFPAALMNAAVLRSVAGDKSGAALAARRAVDHASHNGDRSCVASAVKVATLVLAASSVSGEASATLDGARHGPVLGDLPMTYAGIHQARIDAALDQVARALGPDALNTAQRRGAAMTYDEIIAYTLDQLSRLVEDVSRDG